MASECNDRNPKVVEDHLSIGVAQCEHLIGKVNNDKNDTADRKLLTERLQFDANHLGRRDLGAFLDALNKRLDQDNLPKIEITKSGTQSDDSYSAASVSYTINGEKTKIANLPAENKIANNFSANMNFVNEIMQIRQGSKPAYPECYPDAYHAGLIQLERGKTD
jgi:hypothetical protein